MRTTGSCSLLLATILAGCGGGGGGDSPAPISQPPPNIPPDSQAGSGQTVVEQSTVILDGAGSSDSDGTIVGYRWVQLSGPSALITNATQVSASFVAPVLTVATEFIFELQVTDDDGAVSTDSVVITVLVDTSFVLSGSISVPSSSVADSDVNDPGAQYLPNDTLQNAQSISNPVTVGGYVNLPGAGAVGRSQAVGDSDDS